MDEEFRVTFDAGENVLEGRLSLPPGARRGIVVCHPHPQYGGTMDNPVVAAATTGAARAGVATLRFNFRGVGGSGGRYSGSFGEVADARAALDLMRGEKGLGRVGVIGYSFGAMIACLVGADDPEMERLAAIALPATMFDATCLARCRQPALFLHGDRDPYCSVGALQDVLTACPGSATLRVLAGADHFFTGLEGEIADEIERFVREGEKE